jgi:hypothetical protein
MPMMISEAIRMMMIHSSLVDFWLWDISRKNLRTSRERMRKKWVHIQEKGGAREEVRWGYDTCRGKWDCKGEEDKGVDVLCCVFCLYFRDRDRPGQREAGTEINGVILYRPVEGWVWTRGGTIFRAALKAAWPDLVLSLTKSSLRDRSLNRLSSSKSFRRAAVQCIRAVGIYCLGLMFNWLERSSQYDYCYYCYCNMGSEIMK